MKIIVVAIFVAIMCGMFIFSNFKRRKFYAALILIPGISIVIYQTNVIQNLDYTKSTILGLINVLAIFIISFSFFRGSNTSKET